MKWPKSDRRCRSKSRPTRRLLVEPLEERVVLTAQGLNEEPWADVSLLQTNAPATGDNQPAAISAAAVPMAAVAAPASMQVLAQGSDWFLPTWNAVSGALTYQLSRSAGGGAWVPIYTGLDTSFLDRGAHLLQGTTYQYAVSVMTAAGWSSDSTPTAGKTLAAAGSIEGQFSQGGSTFNVSLFDPENRFGIDTTRDTWILIHGWAPTSPATWAIGSDGSGGLASVMREHLPEDSILAFDWYEAANTGYFGSATAESRIQPASEWLATVLIAISFDPDKVNLIGHSFGAYIANETAERMPSDVHSIIALDPATDPPGANAFNPNDPQEVTFRDNAVYSWAFYDSDSSFYNSPLAASTALQTFATKNAGHSDIPILLGNIIADATSLHQYFQLENLSFSPLNPDDAQEILWVSDSFSTSAADNTAGPVDAIIYATNDFRVGQLRIRNSLKPNQLYETLDNVAGVANAGFQVSAGPVASGPLQATDAPAFTLHDAWVNFGATPANALEIVYYASTTGLPGASLFEIGRRSVASLAPMGRTEAELAFSWSEVPADAMVNDKTFIGVALDQGGPPDAASALWRSVTLHPPFAFADGSASLDATTFGGADDVSAVGLQRDWGDDLIPVDLTQTYSLSGWARSGDGLGGLSSPTARQYFGFASFDQDGQLISPWHVLKFGSAVDTVLTQELKPGDTYVYLNDVSGWSNSGASHTRSLAWYGYANSAGDVYDDYTYTRNVLLNAWSNGAVDLVNRRIALQTPWAGPTLAAGAAVRNAVSAGTYNYSNLSGQSVGENWMQYASEISGVGSGDHQFRAGTAYVRVVLLSNWNGDNGNQVNWSNVRWTRAPETYYGGDVIDLKTAYEGAGLTYAWTQTGGPTVVLTGATLQQASFTAPVDPSGYTLEFQVVVSGDSLQTETIRVQVEPAAGLTAALDATTFGGADDVSAVGLQRDWGDDLIPVDVTQTYSLSGWARSGDGLGGLSSPTARQYFGFASFDQDGQLISPWHVLKFGSAVDTVLTQELKPGDTYVYLNDVSGWSNSGASHTRSLAWYGYTNSAGDVYDDYTYTRNVLLNAWSNGAVDLVNRRIALQTPWAGPTLAAGAAVRNAVSAGTYNYSNLSGQSVGENWMQYASEISGVGSGDHQFRAGTAYVRVVLLSNWNGDNGNQVNWSNVRWTRAPETYYGGDMIDLKTAYEGAGLTYAWTQTGGPTVVLTGATLQQASFTAPVDPSGYTLEFQVVVSGDSLQTETIRVQVEPAAGLTAALDATTFGGADDVSAVGLQRDWGDDLIPVDVTQTYSLAGWARSGDGLGGLSSPTARQYFGFASFDQDGQLISPWHVLKFGSAVDTVLTQELKPGDTYVYLNDVSGWSNSGAGHTRSLAWYGYANSAGDVYDDYTYTRNVLLNAWSNGAVDLVNRRIALQTPWAGPTLAAGAAVRNAVSAGTYNYSNLSGQSVGENWMQYASEISGVGSGDHQFRAGTAYVRVVLLSNWNGDNGNQVNWSNVRWTRAPETYYGGDMIDLKTAYEGAGLTYAWTQTGGPTVVLTGATLQQASFTAPVDPSGYTLEFQVVVSGDSLQTETIRVQVEPAAGLTAALDATTFGGADDVSAVGLQRDWGDDLIPVDLTQTYSLAGWARSGDGLGGLSSPTARQYFGFASFDQDGQLISPWHVLKFGSAVDTVLTQELKPGDTYVYLNDVSGWSNSGAGHTRSLAWYGYANSAGDVYDDYTYTRNVLLNAWSNGAVDLVNRRIALQTPWAGPTLAAGAAVRNAVSAGTYNYSNLSGQSVGENWMQYASEISGVGAGDHQFRAGTAYVRVVLLSNWNGDNGNQVNWSNVRWTRAPETYYGGDVVDLKTAYEGAGLTYAWTQTGGPTVVLTGATLQQASFTAPVEVSVVELEFEVRILGGMSDITQIIRVPVTPRTPVAVVAYSPAPSAALIEEAYFYSSIPVPSRSLESASVVESEASQSEGPSGGTPFFGLPAEPASQPESFSPSDAHPFDVRSRFEYLFEDAVCALAGEPLLHQEA
ncbi:hypothetical protein [Lignipirellula cremea]|uniref:Alpha/beta hydrolase family protein n=1 Tax=Lignipirellula cremea TaxID=2528010 RepID=A0A518DVF5_9BACT|nr:hypothetical protein [Lignipirellula cremea]QDU95813.1 Alpha/beta hydrolase family protein [Lignipirellula cremea]